MENVSGVTGVRTFEAFSDAASAWARVAGTSGAYFPAAVPDLADGCQNVMDLVVRASRAAYDRWVREGSDGPEPRGMDVHFRCGLDAPELRWESDHHLVRLWQTELGWHVQTISDGCPPDCPSCNQFTGEFPRLKPRGAC